MQRIFLYVEIRHFSRVCVRDRGGMGREEAACEVGSAAG